MKRIIQKGIFILLIIFLLPATILGQKSLTAKEVVQKSFNRFLGKSSFSIMEMKIERPTWSRSVTMQNWSLGTQYYITYITAPARDNGEVFLKYKKDMWNYIPAINRLIKIPPSMMMQSWMGSDFTNNDLMKQNSIVTDYTHKFNKSEKYGGYTCYVITLKPLPEAAVVWGSIKIWIAKSNLNALKTEFFDTHGNLIKTEKASRLKIMGGRLLPSFLEMISNTKKGHRTVINIIYQEFNVKGINAGFFSIQRIKSLRPRTIRIK